MLDWSESRTSSRSQQTAVNRTRKLRQQETKTPTSMSGRFVDDVLVALAESNHQHKDFQTLCLFGGAWPCMSQATIRLTAWPLYCPQPLAVSNLLHSSWWPWPASLRGFGAAAVAWHSHFKLPNIDLALLLSHLLNTGAADENTHLDILTDEVVFSGIDIKSQVVG